MSLGLIECLTPVGQKLGDEGVFLIWLHGQWGQREGDGERNVIAHRAGCQCSAIGGMGLIDPDGGFDEPAQLRVIGTVLKPNPKPVPHRSTGTSLTWKHGRRWRRARRHRSFGTCGVLLNGRRRRRWLVWSRVAMTGFFGRYWGHHDRSGSCPGVRSPADRQSLLSAGSALDE